ncbi:MAG: glycosyltransferase family 39 protein [Solirubrobacterales bacterium]
MGVTVLAALLRFPTLAGQSYWYDEIVTVGLLKMHLGDLLSAIPDSENTPPLYYLLAWAWSQLFGTGEFALRSLSAVFGVALVPVVYLLFKELASRRVGLVASLLAAVNPFLVWYSQEARGYALLALLAAISLLLFVRALNSASSKWVVWWAVASALTLCTHYTASFLIGAEALLLLFAHRRHSEVRWTTVGATAAMAAVGGALLPLAIHQRGLGFTDWITTTPLFDRVKALPSDFISIPSKYVPGDSIVEVMKLVSAGLVAVGLVLFVLRARDRERSGGLLMLWLGLLTAAASLALAAIGIDVLVGRNLIVLWLPAMGIVAIGLGAQRAGKVGAAAAAALGILGVATVLVTATDTRYQRDAWDEAASKLGGSQGSPAFVFAQGGFDGALLRYYGVTTEQLSASGLEASNLAVLYRKPNRDPVDQVASPPKTNHLAGMQLAGVESFQQFVIVRFRSMRPVSVTLADLAGLPFESFGCCAPTATFIAARAATR